MATNAKIGNMGESIHQSTQKWLYNHFIQIKNKSCAYLGEHAVSCKRVLRYSSASIDMEYWIDICIANTLKLEQSGRRYQMSGLVH